LLILDDLDVDPSLQDLAKIWQFLSWAVSSSISWIL